MDRVKEPPVSTPQSGIFDRSYAHHVFFEFSLGSGHKTESLRQALRDLVALKSEKTPVLLGFGPDLWACFDSRFSFPPFSLEGHIPVSYTHLTLPTILLV